MPRHWRLSFHRGQTQANDYHVHADWMGRSWKGEAGLHPTILDYVLLLCMPTACDCGRWSDVVYAALQLSAAYNSTPSFCQLTVTVIETKKTDKITRQKISVAASGDIWSLNVLCMPKE